MIAPSLRRLVARTSLALGLSLAAAAAAGHAGAVASTRPAETVTKVMVASGYHDLRVARAGWRVSLRAVKAHPASLTVTLSRLVTGGIETHEWEIPHAQYDGITANQAGDVTIDPSTQSLAPLLKVHLSFTPKRSSASHCSSGSETTYVGHLEGLLELRTGLKGMGTVGGADISLGRTTVTIDRNCVTAVPACATPGITWTVTTATEWGFGLSTSKGDSLALLRTVDLSSPRGATRSDGAAALEPRASFARDRLLEIRTATTGTPITGTARLRATTAPTVRYGTCMEAGVRHTSVSTIWVFARLTRSSLAATTSFGTIRASGTGFGTITRYTIT
jgi:hypothetical protein